MKRVIHDQAFRKALTAHSVYWYGHIYFTKYISYETADFQREIYTALQELTEAVGRDDKRRVLEILGFRNSAKSVIVTMIFIIWAMTGPFAAKYVVLIGQTDKKAVKYLTNIKTQLTENELLIADWGPFKSEKHGADDWQKTSIVIPKYGARIEVYTVNQDIRGIRHNASRPDVVVLDDPDSPKSARKKEQRDKLHEWVKGEIMNVGDLRTLYIFLGNLVHSDGFMARLRKELQSGILPGILIQVPIADADGNPTWPGKFPSKESLEDERRRINNPRAWQRENMLKIIPEDGQIVKAEWVQYWNERMLEGATIHSQCIGVDLAISKKDTADYTAMVRATVVKLADGSKKIFIVGNPVHARLSMFETVAMAKGIAQTVQPRPRFFVESNSYQQAAIEAMTREMLPVEGVRATTDKRARLEAVSTYIQQGTVLFAERGCEDIIEEILYLGSNEHDDLCDATVHAINAAITRGMSEATVVWI